MLLAVKLHTRTHAEFKRGTLFDFSRQLHRSRNRDQNLKKHRDYRGFKPLLAGGDEYIKHILTVAAVQNPLLKHNRQHFVQFIMRKFQAEVGPAGML
jgi:hypothetical protein